MLSGINIEATVKLAQALSIPVIASGGLSNMADIEALCDVESEGVEGVICGRAIYSGDLDFAVEVAPVDLVGAERRHQVGHLRQADDARRAVGRGAGAAIVADRAEPVRPE